MQKVQGQKYRVEIRNSLPNNSKNLEFRCQSKDHDLGYHTLPPEGDFHWDFSEKVFRNTLFFCHFYWGPKNSVFDVYTWDLAKNFCGTTLFSLNKCIWFVAEDGFSLYKSIGKDQGLKMMHRW